MHELRQRARRGFHQPSSALSLVRQWGVPHRKRRGQRQRPLPGPLRERRLAACQAAFFIGTGLWPLLHRTSFERVTGPKTDFWLAQTVGAVVASIGAGLAQAATHSRVPREVRTVAMTSAAGLAVVDLVFVARGRISPVYLLDAAAEAALVAGWLTRRDN
jgi:hypothetical protein